MGSPAGILTFRWHSNDPIEKSLRLKDLACDRRFDITDVDRKATIRMSGRDLAKNGLPITLAEGELSKIFFPQTGFPR
jgi:hypothetical protein